MNEDSANALRYAKRLGRIAEIIADYEMNGSFAEGLTIDRIKAILDESKDTNAKSR